MPSLLAPPTTQYIKTDNVHQPVLEKIRTMATEHVKPTAFVIKTEKLFKHPITGTIKVLVVVLQGAYSSAIDHASPYIEVEIEPGEDGRQVACMMLADGKIAFTLSAIYSTRAFYDSKFYVLWVFDDAMCLTKYPVNDYLDERMHIAHAVACHIQILTQEEIKAWQEVAQAAEYMRIFEERYVEDNEI
ncbi:hypothetical protein NDK50_25370 [Paraburkholderia bryophila]|uniref:hypothetical protein n=1 Tax=Paraburkholderia bryophila TaxID=420952 RepID=UPI002349160E|nr:hypothetical protein [Paraburkholderia bryophila]WCM24165.1 hypothetical protein NDK50_25370 [Paraburkholderia bryophila]